MKSNLRTPGRPKRKEQEPSVQETVLFKASMLFMELGYEAVSLQQIAKACGVTKASIYYYYKGKPELFTAALTAVMRRASERTAALLEEDMPLRERLILVSETKLGRQHADFETIMREARSSLSEEQLDDIRRAEEGIHEIIAGHLARSIEQGEIRQTDPLLTAYALSAVLMVGNREIAKGKTAEKLAREIVDLFWHGLEK
ncbi:TetR/AcrR family transcriptional regulator [Paenibacillus lemnae]|uniref:TetR/AcrR family transcriptional regulator n=1 Tax=Paenibacillus lemnae TaxID=1330551 RepID=A0A848M2L3_PAELE|nr:TetR/AcrR family transcriptional regulator [Paenibacillus lemnae]NMO94491.1 TetR/AcrR family transcriptional regulator [Paenibacillus lemnae]